MAADSRVRRGLRLTPHREPHERLMRDGLARVQDSGLVLKGGTAFAFAWGLNRHSTDLDFDTSRPVKLRDRVDCAARALAVKLGPVDRRDRPMRQRLLARSRTPMPATAQGGAAAPRSPAERPPLGSNPSAQP